MIDVRFDPYSPPVSVGTGPVPTLRIKVVPRASRDGVASRAGEQPPQEYLIGMEPRLTLCGVSTSDLWLENGPRFGEPPGDFVHREATWVAQMPVDYVRAIETARSDDVQLEFSCQMNFYSPSAGMPARPFYSSYPTLQLKLSQKDWLEILEKLGFHGGWVLEIPRPSIAGMADALKFLDAAKSKMLTRDPVGAVSECRRAWDVADGFLDVRPETRDEVINGLSKVEGEEPTKAKRVGEIRRWTDKLSQIGPHSDIYEVTEEDALLVYRLTASLFAYLGSMIRIAESRSTEK